jgi:general secretion pathway protein L
MTKRLIGIDINQKTLRLAILSQEQGILSIVSVAESARSESADVGIWLRQCLDDEFHLGDRLASCMSGASAFVRRLSFPFSDNKKISAALPFELSSQLPIALDDYTIATQPPIREDDETCVLAAAAKTSLLVEELSSFDSAGVPLHFMDLAPHAYVAGLKDFLADGILICALENGTTVALVQSGEVFDYRLLSLEVQLPAKERARIIHREAAALGRASRVLDTKIHLMGAMVTSELTSALRDLHEEVEVLAIDINGKIVESPFLPAVALALRAAETNKAKAFNFRQGDLALKGEWAGLRKAMVIAACLAGLTFLTTLCSMGINYFSKQQKVTQLEEQMVQIYKETFPNSTTVIDVPLQMKSAIRQLQEDVGIIDLDRPSALLLLQTLSTIPKSISVDIDEFTMEREEVRISGRTRTFEEVSRMAESLRKSPHFVKVEVSESKMGLDGKQINYRMRLTLSGKGAAS